MTPGYRTTEFWLSLLGAIAPFVTPNLDPQWQAGLATAATAIYTLTRGAVKRKHRT